MSRRRIDGREADRRLGPLFVVLVALLWGAAWVGGARRPEPDALPFLKRVWPSADYRRLPDGGLEASRRGERLGAAAAATAPGYGGPISVAIAVDARGEVRAAAFLEYRDTPGMRRTLQPLLAALVGRTARSPLALGEDLDAVTGATASSHGVAAAARAALERVAPRPPAAASGLGLGAPELVLLALFSLAFAGRHRRRLAPRTRRLARWSALLASLALLGFLWNRPWTLAQPMRLLAGGLPEWRSQLYWLLLLAGILLVTDRRGRSPWCPWLCPFGAAQDLVGLAGRAHRRRAPARALFAWAKRLLLVAAVALALYHRSPGGASYEVFGTLFRGNGSGFQVAILLAAGLTAIFVSRPFCHWLCPVDPLERSLRWLRRRMLALAGAAPPLARRERRPLLRVLPGRPQTRDPLRVARDRLLIFLGLLCVAFAAAHLASAFRALSDGNQFGLLGETLVVAPAAGE